MKVLIDNGHGENTKGKRSPDGKLREYAWTREIADMLVLELGKMGIDAERVVKETIDVPLSERCRRVNEICGRLGTSNVILISIHLLFFVLVLLPKSQ
jgi:N-acetylmuramoyl-L-alanine amidase